MVSPFGKWPRYVYSYRIIVALSIVMRCETVRDVESDIESPQNAHLPERSYGN